MMPSADYYDAVAMLLMMRATPPPRDATPYATLFCRYAAPFAV